MNLYQTILEASKIIQEDAPIKPNHFSLKTIDQPINLLN